MGSARLRQDRDSSITEVDPSNWVRLPHCPRRRCPRCREAVEMRSYAGGYCEQCWQEMAARCCWNGLLLNSMTHARRR